MGTKPVLYMPRYYCTIMERHLNGKDTIYKENALVQYDDENNEYFYPGDKDNGTLYVDESTLIKVKDHGISRK